MIIFPRIFYVKHLAGGGDFKMINQNMKSFSPGANQLLINDNNVSHWKFYKRKALAAATINLADHF